jgi:hypothetical protein
VFTLVLVLQPPLHRPGKGMESVPVIARRCAFQINILFIFTAESMFSNSSVIFGRN